MARFLDAYPVADLATLRPLLAPDALIWHNFDRREQSVDENLALIAGIVAAGHTLRYTRVRRLPFDGGCVQLHRVEGITPGGEAWSAEACAVFTITKGQIVRIDEYVDAAQLAPLAM